MKTITAKVEIEVPNGSYCIEKKTGIHCQHLKLDSMYLPMPFCRLFKEDLDIHYRYIPIKCRSCFHSPEEDRCETCQHYEENYDLTTCDNCSVFFDSHWEPKEAKS